MSRNPPRHTIEHGGFSMPPRNPNSQASRVERYLRDNGNATSADLVAALGGGRGSISSTLSNLAHMGRAHVSGKRGRHLVYSYGAATFNSNVSGPRRFMAKGDYDGAELRRNPGIPDDRFRAFELPSIVNGERVPAKRITAQCVGALKDSRSVGG